MNGQQLLLELIGVAVCGKAPTEALKQACTPEALANAYSLGEKHDLAHLVGQAAAALQLADSELLEKCQKAAMHGLVRYTRQELALQKACSLLEQGQIPFIPLKGSVLRRWYPEPWLRTSCDIDILVRPEDLPQAQKRLEECGWRYLKKSSHDLSLLSPERVHLELHHITIEDYVSEKSKEIMDGIWADARPLPDRLYHMELSDGLFYYYHMAHMAKHLIDGGCGIRSFLDTWILNHRVSYDEAARRALLERGGLASFAEGVEKLAEIWFSEQPMDGDSELLERFVIGGGTYGTVENRVSLQQGQERSKWRFVLKRIFQPYHIIKYRFPILQKHKWLTPFFQPIRWLQLLFGGKGGSSAAELRTAAQVSEDTQTAARKLLDYLGL